MKRIMTVALALVMLFAFVACGKASVKGTTWEGTADVTAKLKESLVGSGFEDYLKDLKIDMKVSFTDKDANIKYDTTSFEAAFRKSMENFLADHPEMGAGLDMDEFMEGFVSSFRANFPDMTKSYTLDGKDITIGEVKGTVSGKKMTLTFPELGDIDFSRK